MSYVPVLAHELRRRNLNSISISRIQLSCHTQVMLSLLHSSGGKDGEKKVGKDG